MAQLSNDCFVPGAPLISLDTALAILRQRLTPVVATESCALVAAAGRILSADIVATRDVPPTDNSAVDGYALRHGDLASGETTTLTVVGRAAAGHPWAGQVASGQAVRIFTGAAMPAGADTVMMQEDGREAAGNVTVAPGIKSGSNRRRAGEDVAVGQIVAPAGRRLRPAHVGLAAAQGLSQVMVYRRLTVAVFSTGDEVRDSNATGDSTVPDGAIYDANRPMLLALLHGLGMATRDMGVLPDQPEAIGAALARAAHGPNASDVVITSGGMSVGAEDHMRAAVEAIGRLDFWRLAIKPGRPVAFGAIERQKANPAADSNGPPLIFIGLPGNPVAAVVTFLRLARPAVLRLAGGSEPEPLPLPVAAAFAMTKKPGRREWVRVRLIAGSDGRTTAERFPRDGAGILSSLAAADGLVELPEATTHVTKGDIVDFFSFGELT